MWDVDAHESLRQAGLQWLSENGTTRATWSAVWARLWDDSLRGMGEAWLNEFQQIAGWGKLWILLCREHGSPALLDLADGWLTSSDRDDPEWGHVWRTRWEMRPNEHLRTLGVQWLCTNCADDHHWASVWLGLMDRSHSAELIDLASQWLLEVDWNHHSWVIVWLVVQDHRVSECHRELGVEWLIKAQPTHSDWGRMWLRMWERDRIDSGRKTELARQGTEWLTQVESAHRQWPVVWHRLWSEYETEELCRSALRWLKNTPANHRGWAWVLTAILRSKSAVRHHGRARVLGKRWLSHADLGHPGWSNVWVALVGDLDSPGSDLVRLALGRLTDSSTILVDEWSALWQRIWERDNGAHRAILVECGMVWLRSVPEAHRSWQYVWTSLIASCEEDATYKELYGLGECWLQNVDMNHHSWPFVWSEMWDRGEADGLQECGLKWLEGRNLEVPGLGMVLSRLLLFCEERSRLQQIGEEYLSTIDPHRKSWSLVSRAMTKKGGSE